MAPVLIVRDLAASVAYYRDRLGVDVIGTFGQPLEMAFVGRGGIQLMLQDAEGRPTPGPNGHYKSVAWDALIWVSDVRSLHVDLDGREARIRKPPHLPFYGHTEIEVFDLDDHLLCFSEPPASP